MFFRAAVTRIFLISAVALGMTGCGFLNGHSEKDKEIHLDIKEMACLREAPQNIGAFFNDSGDEKDFISSMKCFQQALLSFKKRARSQGGDSYNAKDIKDFFNEYLLEEYRISNDFLTEVMRFKSALLGGTVQVITGTEIDAINKVLDKIMTQVAPLRGQLKTLTFRAPRASDTRLEALQTQTRQMVHELLGSTQILRSSYTFEDFILLAREVLRFIKAEENSTKSLSLLYKWLPLAEKVKSLFLGSLSTDLSEKEINGRIDWLISVYFTALKFKYVVSQLNLTVPEDWKTLLEWGDEVFEKIDQAPIIKVRGGFSMADIDKVIDEVWLLKVFDLDIDASWVKENLRRGILYMLQGMDSNRDKAFQVMTLSLNDIKVLKHEYQVFALAQKQTIAAFCKKGSCHHTDPLLVDKYLELIDTPDVKKHIREAGATPEERRQLEMSFSEWKSLFEKKHPVIYNKDNQVAFVYEPRKVPMPFLGFTLANGIRSLIRFILRGYGDHGSDNLFKTQVTAVSFSRFGRDFREFALGLRFLDPRVKDSMERIFRESNWFAMHGDGNQQMSSSEAYEIFNILISGGLILGGKVYDDLEAMGCKIPKTLDPFGLPHIKESCFYNYLHQNAEKVFTGMPMMAKFIASLSKENFHVFYKNLIKLTRTGDKPLGEIEYAEIRGITSVLQYVESLLVLYDKNRNETFSVNEIYDVHPRFRSSIIDFAPKFAKDIITSAPSAMSHWMTSQVLLYLCYEGKAPKGAWDMAQFEIGFSAGHEADFDLGEIDRYNFFKVLGALKEAQK